MAKSDARRTKGQAKPGKERDPPGAVRAGEDAKTGGGGGPGSGQTLEWSRYPYKGGDINYPWSGGDGSGGTFTSNDKSTTGRAESISKVGMETGANNGRPEREGAEAKGGERAAGVSDGGPDQDIDELCAQLGVRRGDYDRVLHWTKSERVVPTWEDAYNLSFLNGLNDQDREAPPRTNRKTIAAILVGLTLGLLLPLAYQMVSRG